MYCTPDRFIYTYLHHIVHPIVRRNDIMNGCCGPSGVSRSRGFLTNEEKVEMLNEYKESLEKETKGVLEKIKELERNN